MVLPLLLSLELAPASGPRSEGSPEALQTVSLLEAAPQTNCKAIDPDGICDRWRGDSREEPFLEEGELWEVEYSGTGLAEAHKLPQLHYLARVHRFSCTWGSEVSVT